MNILEITDGNPGAISVIAQLLNDADADCSTADYFEILHSHRITGIKLWLAYKYGGKDIETLKRNLQPLNQEMVNNVNDEARLYNMSPILI